MIGIRPRHSICRQMLKLTATREGSRTIMRAANAIDENNPPCREGERFERRGPAANFATAIAAIPNVRAPIRINSHKVKRGLHKPLRPFQRIMYQPITLAFNARRISTGAGRARGFYTGLPAPPALSSERGSIRAIAGVDKIRWKRQSPRRQAAVRRIWI